MQHFRRAPPPPNHQRAGIDQLIGADRMVFVSLLENGAKPRANLDGTCDLDTALQDALNSYQVSSLLSLRPAGTKRKLTEPSKPQPWKSNTSPTFKGKGKGKVRIGILNLALNRSACPPRLCQLGGKPVTKARLRICFGYNLEGCKFKDRCHHTHVCAKCEGPHPIGECTSP